MASEVQWQYLYFVTSHLWRFNTYLLTASFPRLRHLAVVCYSSVELKCSWLFLPSVHFPSHFSRFLFLSNALTNSIHRASTCLRGGERGSRRGELLPYPVAPKWARTVTKTDSLIEQPTILPSICRQLTGGIFVIVVAEKGVRPTGWMLALFVRQTWQLMCLRSVAGGRVAVYLALRC